MVGVLQLSLGSLSRFNLDAKLVLIEVSVFVLSVAHLPHILVFVADLLLELLDLTYLVFKHALFSLDKLDKIFILNLEVSHVLMEDFLR